MNYRRMGRLNWRVSEIGYGMWGIAGGPGNFTGANPETAPSCLDLAVEMGCNFFDTAWAYGRGVSEQMLGRLLRSHPGRRLYVATKIPPKNWEWPPRPGDALDDVFPASHIREYALRSLENLGVDRIDLLQFHVWEDRWAQDEQWQRALGDLRAEGLIEGIGVSVNRWEPKNCLKTIDTGLVDVIQVIYNIFDQAPEDTLFKVAAEKDIGIIARVPFDEGGLTGTLTGSTRFPADDWRSTYFGQENLGPTVERAEALKSIVPAGATLPELSLRFILHHPAVSTVIPGMRQERHVRANLSASDGKPLPPQLLSQLRAHRWDRAPTAWSQ
ncbi:MAG: aldo/keto reductase [Ramlibacter sp.]|nr:aldo/keto reductase [Ramlibacter sp.]